MRFMKKSKNIISFILLFLLCINSFSFNAIAEDGAPADSGPVLNSVGIISNNANPSAAKVGDVVTVSIASNEDLGSSPVIKIAGKDVTAAGSGKNWAGTYTMADGDTEGQVSFSVDIARDPVTTVNAATNNSSVKFYKTKPIITLDSSKITIAVNSTYIEGTTAKDSLGGDLTAEITKSPVVDSAAVGTYAVKYNVKDAAGNNADEVTKTVDVQPKASDSTMSGIVGNIPKAFTGNEFVFIGDTLSSIKITALPSYGKLMLDEAEVNKDAVIEASKLSTLSFVAVNDFSGNDSFKWTGVGLKSIASNEATVNLTSTINSPPSKPNSFISPQSGQSYDGGENISVSWGASTDPEGAVSYILEFSSNGTHWTQIYSGSAAAYSFNDTAGLNAATAQFRVKAIDAENLGSEYTTSDAFTINSVLLQLTSVNILSNNVNNHTAAKVLDKITVSIVSNEDLAAQPVIKIAGQAAEVTGSGKSWTGSYTMAAEDTAGPVGFTIDFTDMEGKPGTQVTATTDLSSVNFYKTKPVITLDFPKITIKVNDNYTDLVTAADELNGNLTAQIIKSGDEVKTGLVGTYAVTYNVKDAAGNEAVPVTKTVTVQPKASDSTKSGIIGNIPEAFTGDEFVFTGDTLSSIKITALPAHGKLMLGGVEVIKDDVVEASELNTLSFVPDNNFSGDDLFKWIGKGSKSIESNEATVTLVVMTNSPPSKPNSFLLPLLGQSYKGGGNVTASWEISTDPEGGAVSYILEFSYNGTDWAIIYNGSDTAYSYSDTAGKNAAAAQFRVKAKDTENYESEYTTSNAFTVDSTLPKLNVVSIISNNATPALAKVGEDITVSITSDEDLAAKPVIKIAGKEAAVSGDKTSWTGTYRMAEEDTEGLIEIAIDYTDIAGNAGVKVTAVTDVSSVTFDKTKPVISLNDDSEITIPVNSTYTDAATASDSRDGDLTRILNKTGSVDTSKVGTYVVTYNVSDVVGNNAVPVTKTVHVRPIASDSTKSGIVGNLAKGFSAGEFALTGDIISNIMITQLPSSGKLMLNGAEVKVNDVIEVSKLDTLNFLTDNIFPGADSTKSDSFEWTGIGAGQVYSNKATMSLTIAKNVPPSNPGSITGVTEGQRFKEGKIDLAWEASTDSDGDSAVITYTLEFFNGTGWTPVYAGALTSFSFSASTELNCDIAQFRVKAKDQGNIESEYTTSAVFTIDNTLPILSFVSIKSSSKTSYGKIGDKITLSFTSSEALKGLPTVKIAGKNATVSAASDLTWTAEYIMTVDDAEGIIQFSVDFVDLTGIPGTQVTTTNDSSQIVFDRTKPVISLNGLPEVTIEAKTSYTDPGAASTEGLTDSIVSSGSVNADVVGDYIITYNVTDGSGNAAVEVTRTVHVKDTTKPVIALTGSPEVTLEVHSAYTDEGAAAADIYDGNLTGSIVVYNPVDKDKVGTYTITYNVTDSNSNIAVQVIRTVNVVDTTIPVITITLVDGKADLTIEVGSTYTDAGATATDNYDSDASITAKIVSSGSVNAAVVGEYTINYNVTDTNGNKASQVTRTVHVVDTQIPVITRNGDEVVTLEVHASYTDQGATALDNYDGNLTGKIVINNSVKANVVGTYTVTYNVKDSSGNSAATVQRTVIVRDTTKPIITLKGVRQDGNSDVTIQVHGVYDSNIAKASATATDNYDGDMSSKITVDNPVLVDTVGTYTVTFNVTDANGNAAIPVTRKVHVVDTQKPVIALNGSSTVTVELKQAYTDAGATVTDNYDPDRVIEGTGTVDINNVQTYTIRFNATDANGNVANQVSRTISVIDVTKPVITLTNGAEGTTDYTMEVHGSYVEPGYDANDPDDGNLKSSVVISNPVIVDKVGVYTITYNVTEPHGHKADQVTRIVHVVDTTKPVITLKGNNIITGSTDVWVEAKKQDVNPGDLYIEPGYTATDNYDGDLTGEVTVSGTVDIGIKKDYIITYNVDDASGNSAVQVTRTVHVVDTIKPVLALVGSSVVSIPQGGTYTDTGVTATDSYEDSVYLNSHLVISVNGDIVADRPVTLTTPGTYVLIYSVSDSSGNAAKSARRTVYVNGDGGPGPQITIIPGEDTVEVKTDYNVMAGVTAKDRNAEYITDLVTAAVKDPNGADVSGSISASSIKFSLVGDYIITYRVTEPTFGGNDSEIRIVHVVDTTKPVLTLIGDATVETEVHKPYTDKGATAADNYDSSDVLSNTIIVKNSVVINKVGTYIVTYNVTDSNGKAADGISRTVNVADTTKPVITLLGPSIITLEAKSTYTEHGAVATDNYDKSCSVTISGTLDMDVVGDYTLTYSAVDANNNAAANVTRTIRVRDTIRPVITLIKPEGSASTAITLEVHTAYTEWGATAVDGYDGMSVNVTINASNLNKDVLGTYTVSYTATDARTNTATVYRTVHVVDTTKPVITLLGSAIVTLEVHTNYTDAGATAEDNYDGNLTNSVFVVNPVISDVVGTYTVTYTLSDANGNKATATRTVNIVDTTKPVITINGSSVLTIPINTAYTDAGATASDNYDGDITNKIASTGTVDTTKVGTYNIAYGVTDAHDNIAVTKTRTVYVQPIASALSKPGVQNVQMKFTFDEFSSKLSGDTLSTIKIVTLPSNGILKNNGTAVSAGDTFNSSTISNLVYIPNNNRVGKDSFNWSAVGAVGIWSNNAAVNFDIVPNIPPTIPGSFTGFTAAQAFKGGTSTTIGWGASTDPDGNLGNLINYVLEFSNDGGAAWTELTVVTNTSYTYTWPAVNTTSARFRVKAKDAGNFESDYRTSLAFTIDSNAPTLTTVRISSNNSKPNYAKTGEEVTVTFTASEELSTAPVVTIAGHIAAVTGSGTSWVGKYTLINTDPEGEIPFAINYSDLVGNEGTAVSSTTDSSKVTFDITKPVIGLLGEHILTTPYGNTYTDAGATAVDTLDGTITASITAASTVTNSVGIYTVTYNVKDNAGNSADPVVRTVTVQPKALDGTKAGIENITTTFVLSDFTSKYSNDTLSSIRITSLPTNGTLKVNGGAVSIGADIVSADISKLTFVPNSSFHDTDSFKWTAVGNKGIRSTEATMSLNIIKNIPPTIPGAITGVLSGQKVKGGNTVLLAWGASSDTDNGGIPLNYILEFSTDGSTWAEIYSGTTRSHTHSTPVTDVITAQYRVKAKDAGGFESAYRNSVVYTIDSTPPILTKAHITSSNSNTALAKSTDVITISFEANESLWSLPVVTIAGKSTAVTGSGSIWTAKYTMGNTDTEGPIQISIDYRDDAGNIGVKVTGTLDSSAVIFDRTNPILSLIGPSKATTPFSDVYNDAGATASDSREGDISGSITPTSTVVTGTVGHYKITYNVKDGAGNSAAPVIRDVDVQPKAIDGSVSALENIPYGFAVNDFQSCFKGDTANGIRITSLPAHGILKNGDAVVKNNDDISSISNLSYIPDTGYHGNDLFMWNSMGIIGIRSTDATMSIVVEENFPPSAPGAFTGIASGTAIKGGTTIPVKFGVSTDADGDRGIPMKYVLEYTSDGNSWAQIYVGCDTSFNHNPGSINTDKAQYRVKALDGGNLLSGYTYSNIFTIDSSAPVLSPVSIISSNNTPSLAKSGDEIILSFTANKTLKESPIVKIAGHAAVVAGSGTSWSAKYIMAEADTEGQIPFSIEFEDALGNKGVTVTSTTDSSKVIYDRTKPIITVTGTDDVIEVYSSYTDKGATASDNYDTAVNGKIISAGTVNADVLGDYKITYNVTDAAGNAADEASRVVQVKDRTKPVITLKGSPEVTIAIHSLYTDSGAAATDNYDSSADITKNIIVANLVNKDVIGDYTVTYDVEDAHGNKADRVTRIVHVIGDKIQLYGKITEQDTGKVIPNAKVSLYDLSNSLKHEATADSNGDYIIDNVILGQYKLVVENQKYSTKSIGIKLMPEDVSGSKIKKDVQLVNFIITLTSNPNSIIGDGVQTATFDALIVDKDNKPIPQIEVKFSAEMGSFPNGDTKVTGPDGKCSVTYKSVKIEGTENKRITVKAEVNDIVKDLHASNEIIITYEPSVIKGIVVDNDTKEKIKGAIVEVSKDFNGDGIVDFYAKFITGDDGKYVIAVPKGKEDYEIRITKPVQVNGTAKDMTFNQTCSVDDPAGAGNENNSQNTIAGLLLYREPDGTAKQLDDYSKYEIKVTEKQNGAAVIQGTIDKDNEKGVFQADGLENGKTYTVEVTYDMGGGIKIKVGDAEVNVSSDGQIGISTILIDPYGTITDAATGSVISGAEVTLWYANTARNIAAGKVPDDKVILPGIAGFAPNDNANPQASDLLGKYAFMVYFYTDYYITATMAGYQDYTSPTIPVEDKIVQWDFKMNPLGGAGIGTPPADGTTGVKRIAGDTRIDTAIEIAKATFKDGVKNVVIARSDIFADALSGSVLSYKYDAPILLVGQSESDLQKVLIYMKDTLDVDGNVFILGEYGAVSTYVEQRIRENFKGVKRIGGADRYETSAKIAEYLNVSPGTPVVIASGEDFPDALSISSAAALRQYPILLVQKDEVPEAIGKKLIDIKPAKTFIIGLQGAVSEYDEEQILEITALDKSNVVRIGGIDRYETSIEAAKYFNMKGSSVGITTGSNFPDALASSIFGAKFNTQILLLDEKLNENTIQYLKDKKLKGIVIFGGTGAISRDLEEQLTQMIIK